MFSKPLNFVFLILVFWQVHFFSPALQSRTISKTPSVPSGLAVTNVTSNSVSIKWSAAKDYRGGKGIKDYDIYRFSTRVGTTPYLAYTDQNLSPSTLYQYSVRSRNLEGGVSALSTPLSVTTLAPPCSSSPSAPTGLAVSWVSSMSQSLEWNPVSPPPGCTLTYSIYRNSALIMGGLSIPNYTDTGLLPSTTYTYTVSASDVVGESPLSSPVLGTTAASSGTAFPNYVFAPYTDMLLWPTPSLSGIATQTGSQFFSLGFIVARTATECTASWGTYYTMPQNFLLNDIATLRARGGDIIPSFGGAANSELALVCASVSALQAQYQSVIDTYKVTRLDFDIEGEALGNATANDRRAKALAALQGVANSHGKTLKIQFTLPVLPTGLTSSGLALLQNAIQNGVDISTVNIMAMNYGSGYDPSMMGQHAINAMMGTLAQLKNLYGSRRTDSQIRAMIGVTPMIGFNDIAPEVFTLSDASLLLNAAKQYGIGFLGFWSTTRDTPCSNGPTLSSTCSGVTQAPWDYTSAFKAFTRN